MPRQQVQVTVASKGPLIAKSLFNNYDVCLNTYVGCEFGCTYCYVRNVVKDPDKDWGDFVRLRTHIADRLPVELNKGHFKLATGKVPMLDDEGRPVLKDGKQRFTTLNKILPIEQARMVIGTMVDPYQPVERKARLTRTALQLITGHRNQFNKVGIFTRSPLVLEDLDLIAKLPRARVHFTVTPFPPEIMRKIEPISPRTDRRWEVLKAIKAAGIRLHVNVSPVIPLLSDGLTEEFAERLAEIEPAETFVDPFQPYAEALESFRVAMEGDERWGTILQTLNTRELYQDWKDRYRAGWQEAWARHGAGKKTLMIWSDHQYKVWNNLATGQDLDQRLYGDDME